MRNLILALFITAAWLTMVIAAFLALLDSLTKLFS